MRMINFNLSWAITAGVVHLKLLLLLMIKQKLVMRQVLMVEGFLFFNTELLAHLLALLLNHLLNHNVILNL